MPRRIFITLAEHSADLHAANLITSLRKLDPTLAIEAFAGPETERAGATIHRQTTRNAAMGPAAISRIAETRRLIGDLRKIYSNQPADLHICIDSWAMNWHFAKVAKSAGTPVLYYIAPQTWASREGRVKKMRRVVDKLACILPFEQDYFRGHGIDATFVGHPLFDQLPPNRTNGPAFDSTSPPIIGLLTGSRSSVVRANTPRLLDVAHQILARFPDAQFLAPTTTDTDSLVRQIATQSPTPIANRITIQPDAFDQFVPRCHLCLTVSGTAALHVAAYRVPLIVVYRGNPILWHLLARWIVKARTYSLVNILSGQEEKIAPEFIPWYGSTKPVADHAINLLQNPARLNQMRKDLNQMIQPIDHPGASTNCAQIALDLMNRPFTR